MPTLLVFHEVDDVDKWLSVTTREERFGPHGITAKALTNPEGSGRPPGCPTVTVRGRHQSDGS